MAMLLRTSSDLLRLVALALLTLTSMARAGTISIQRTPILSATLSLGTYQVESSANGTTWQPTGVLVAGNGAAVTVRLDGFPGGSSYRYSQIETTALVTPSVVSGWSLSNSFPGATELRIEAAPSLTPASWALRQYVFPDFNGAFLSAVTNTSSPAEFFRSLEPAAPLQVTSVASYSADPNVGYSGFGIVADDMPQLYRDGFIAAPCPNFYHRGGTNAAAAGECYELTGPFGTTMVIVGDLDDVPPAGTCEVGRTYMDIGTPAFTNMFAEPAGYGTATYRVVPAPVTGSLKLVVPINSGGFYFEMRPYNHRAGVSKVEIRGTGGSWVELPRSVVNSFAYTGSAPTFPLSVRVTSRFGEVIYFPPIASMTSGQRFTATNQFSVFPPLDPAPVWIRPPVYRDSLSNQLGAVWSATPYSGATVNTANAAAAYQGTAGFSISNLTAFAGVILFNNRTFPAPTGDALEFAIRSATTTAATNLAVMFGGYDSAGNPTNSSTIRLPAISNAWRVIRIPLQPALAPARLSQVRFSNNGSSVAPPVYLDSIFFRQP